MTAATWLPRLLLAAAFALVLGSAQGAFAQSYSNPNPSANSIALAKDLLVLKGGHQMFDNMVDNVIDRARDTFIPTNPNLAKPLGEVAAQLHAEFAPKKAEVLNEIAKAYARHFTEAELKELLAFYKTSLGRKVLSEESAAVEDGFKRAQSWSQAFSDQVLGRLRAEMKKKGYDL